VAEVAVAKERWLANSEVSGVEREYFLASKAEEAEIGKCE
jgi:hypothetical protein